MRGRNLTIYIKKEHEPIFTKIEQLPDISMSEAIAEALHMYLKYRNFKKGKQA